MRLVAPSEFFAHVVAWVLAALFTVAFFTFVFSLYLYGCPVRVLARVKARLKRGKSMKLIITALIALVVVGSGCEYMTVEQRETALAELEFTQGHEYLQPSACAFWEGDPEDASGLPTGYKVSARAVDGSAVHHEWGYARIENWGPNAFPQFEHRGAFSLWGWVPQSCGIAGVYSVWQQHPLGNIIDLQGMYFDGEDYTLHGIMYDACGVGLSLSLGMWCDPAGPPEQWIIEATLTDASPGTFGGDDFWACPEKYNVMVRYDRPLASCS